MEAVEAANTAKANVNSFQCTLPPNLDDHANFTPMFWCKELYGVQCATQRSVQRLNSSISHAGKHWQTVLRLRRH
jgi:hypothetical protein